MKTLTSFPGGKESSAALPCEFAALDSSHADFVMPWHKHSSFELLLVRAGRLRLTLNGVEHRLFAGDMAFLPGEALHSIAPENNDCQYDCALVELPAPGGRFTDSVTDGILKGQLVITPTLSFTDARPVWEALTRLMDLHRADKMPQPWISLGMVYQLFGRLVQGGHYSEAPRANEELSRWAALYDHIEAHFAEKLTLEGLAQVAGLSPKYLCRAFAKLAGTTPLSFLNEYRLDMARRLLSASTDSVSQIAASCGFQDQSYFVKQFRQRFGVTPGAYRRR